MPLFACLGAPFFLDLGPGNALDVLQVEATPRAMQRPKIIDLPNEILQEVFDLLPQISQGCFALSCRRLYQDFRYILNEPMFQFHCVDGIVNRGNIEPRSQFLKKIQSPRELWLNPTSKGWIYCNECLKLHPSSELRLDYLDNDRKPHCQWPGIISLCPCLTFPPRGLIRISHELSRASFKVFDGGDIKRSIPDWHRCSFVSPCGKLSYSLNISLSLPQEDRITFHFNYWIKLDEMPESPYKGERKIMLLPYLNAIEIIRLSTSPKSEGSRFSRRRAQYSHLQRSGYKISFKRTLAYNIPEEDGDPCFEADYVQG